MALKKTHAQFRAAKAGWEADHPNVSRTFEGRRHWQERRALYLCWWFIENVTRDDPANSEIFFELRKIVRDAEQGAEHAAG